MKRLPGFLYVGHGPFHAEGTTVYSGADGRLRYACLHCGEHDGGINKQQAMGTIYL
jgi:hypothetical protein